MAHAVARAASRPCTRPTTLTTPAASVARARVAQPRSVVSPVAFHRPPVTSWRPSRALAPHTADKLPSLCSVCGPASFATAMPPPNSERGAR
jgi:hypothetical protein